MDKIYLAEQEKKGWILFQELAYKEDVKLAEELVLKYPRWSVVAGYYAMHDITKLYLAKIHNMKISGEKVHSAAIELLKEVLSEGNEKQRLLDLLTEAEKEYRILREGKIHLFLRQGRDERTTAQYYLGRDNEMFSVNFSRKASDFLETIVGPFIAIIERML